MQADGSMGDMALGKTMDQGEDDTKAVDLWPVARPQKHYEHTSVAAPASASYLVALTGTAHPALSIAGRLLKLEVLVFLEGATAHSIGHGQELLESTLLNIHWAEAARLTTSTIKRVRASTLQFIEVEAAKAGLFIVNEVEPEAGSGWRSGMNLLVHNLAKGT